MSVPALGCCVCAIEAGSCSEAAGAQRCPGQLPPAPCGPSPRASEVQPGDMARMPARAQECLGTPRPHRVAGRALPSPVEIKHRMGMEREGVWQQPAAGSGRGLAEGSSCTCPGVLHVQLLPLTRAYIQQRCESGVPAAGSSEAPAVPMLGGEQAAACSPGHAPGNTRSWGRGRGGSSHFTLFREYEFTCKSRGWALSRLPGPPAVETGSRSCTKWEQGGGRGPEQLVRGITGHAFRWETAGWESWGCRNLLKTLFFP